MSVLLVWISGPDLQRAFCIPDDFTCCERRRVSSRP